VGLAVCRRIAEVHGGRIWVVSEPGEGACFHVTVPVWSGQSAPEPPPPAPPPPRPAWEALPVSAPASDDFLTNGPPDP
jgi:two-component system clock-associated histidine kinase SasA